LAQIKVTIKKKVNILNSPNGVLLIPQTNSAFFGTPAGQLYQLTFL
jgi:hypothetical protein